MTSLPIASGLAAATAARPEKPMPKGSRATLALTNASRANACFEGRPFVTPQDVKSVAMDILRHRVILTYEAEAEEMQPEDAVQRILDGIKVP